MLMYQLMEIRRCTDGDFSEPFEITIEFKKECPACGHDFMIKPSHGMAACPKCDRGTLDLISLGKWD